MKPIRERGVEETLDAVESVWLASVEAGCEVFLMAAHYAHLCGGRGLPQGADAARAGERAVRLGGVGTPLVSEFAAAAFGARVRTGTVGARAMIADALDVEHRLPLLHARVLAREVRVPWVRHVARATRELSVAAAAEVDAAVVEVADGRVPWSRFEAVVAGAVVAADPERAARREAQAREAVFARASRFSDGGMRSFTVRASTGLVVGFDATVAFLAQALRALGDTDEEDVRRVKACAVLANPMQAVELLAAFAAHRAQTPTDHGGDVSEPEPEDAAPPPPDPADIDPAGADEASPAQEGADPTGADGRGPIGEARGDADDADANRGGPAGSSGGDADDVDVRGPGRRPDVDEPCSADEDHDEPGIGGGVGGGMVPRRFRPSELPGWLRRATDPDSRWRFDTRVLLPRVTMFVHLAEETLAAYRRGSPHGAVRPEGDAPVTLQYLFDQVLPYQAVRVTPVLDLAGQEPVDGYEIPRRHRQAVRLRTPADCFPFAANLDPVDIDHTEAYRHAPGPDGRVPPGQSRMDNYGPLGRHHHRVKTHGGWQVKQPFAGIYVWRDPLGHFFLVDHTGTRKITPPRPIPTRPSQARPRPVVVEVYRHTPHIDLDLAG